MGREDGSGALSALDLEGSDDLPFGGDEPEAPHNEGRRLLTCRADGSHGFSELKRLNLSGRQYIHACNEHRSPTPDMLIGTAVHEIVLGGRPGKKLVRFDGRARRGRAWEAFAERHRGAEIVTETEWEKAEKIARCVLADPLAMARLEGSRLEVPLEWEEDEIRYSTGGVDIIQPSARMLGDLKTTKTVEPARLMRQAFSMLYHCQLAFYRRGARANGIDTQGAFLLCVETGGPHEVVDLELTPELLELGDKTVALWIEKLRRYRDAGQWPGYAQSPIAWDVPEYMRADDYEDDEESP